MGVKVVKIESAIDSKSYDLTPKQSQALPLIVSGMSNKAVADEVGVNVWTVSRWINHVPEFKRAVKAELEVVTDRARRLLAANAVTAAKTLIETSRTGKGSANRTKAAQLILDRAGIVAIAQDGSPTGGINPTIAGLMTAFKQQREKENQHEE